MPDAWMSLSTPMVLSRLAGAKTCTRRLVARDNSLLDGHVPTREAWERLDWSEAYAGMTIAGDHTWLVPDATGTMYRIAPRLRPGDTVHWREQTMKADCWACYGAGGNYVETGMGRAEWLKADGTPYRVSSLAPRYMPHAWGRLVDTIKSVVPSTPAEVNTAEEATAEGLIVNDNDSSVYWQGALDEYDTPQAAYLALLRELHAREVAADAPCWRVGF